MEDPALEKNRRVAWARFFGARAQLEAARMQAAELAVWLEELDVDDGPVGVLIDEALAEFPDHVLSGIRRYVRWQRDVHAGVAVNGWATG